MVRRHFIKGRGIMNMQEIENWYEENKRGIYTVVGTLLVFLLCVWIVQDYKRGKAIYNDTNIILDGIDQRVKNAGTRIDNATESVGNAEKAVTDAVGRIERSEESAGKIADGIGECERRVDSLIQRQGRIANIVTEIERINRP